MSQKHADVCDSIVAECDRALTTWVGSQAAIKNELPNRVQSMMSAQADGENSVQTKRVAKPRMIRTWSSDSEEVEDSTTKKSSILVK